MGCATQPSLEEDGPQAIELTPTEVRTCDGCRLTESAAGSSLVPLLAQSQASTPVSPCNVRGVWLLRSCISQVYCQLAWPSCRTDGCLALVTQRLATTREHATEAGKGEAII